MTGEFAVGDLVMYRFHHRTIGVVLSDSLRMSMSTTHVLWLNDSRLAEPWTFLLRRMTC